MSTSALGDRIGLVVGVANKRSISWAFAKAALESSVRYLAYDLGPQRVRVNAISAGPVKTAAARGIPGFMDMYNFLNERSPIKDEFTANKVATAAVFLASDGASAITGETLFVDNGYHMMGM